MVKSESGNIREPEQGEPVFIIIDGIPVPFFTREAYSPSPGTLVIAFDDYETDKSVNDLKGCEVRSDTNDGEQQELFDLKGYRIIDNASGFTGTIIEILPVPGQILASVEGREGVILVPIHPDLIIKTDSRHHTIYMSLPAGLTGINE